MNRFYVYEHWRPDLDICFWVAKGTGDRAYRFKRNQNYDRVVKGLADNGMCVEVRMVQSGLTEFEALAAECERIAFWKSASVQLTNRVDGGRGNRGLFVSEATRQKLRAANLGKKHSPETRAKMRATHAKNKKKRGRGPGFRHSDETRAKIAIANIGKSPSTEAREKLRRANLGKKHTAETRMKMSEQRIGNTHGAGGKGLKRSEETRLKMSAAQRGKVVSRETRAKISATLKARAET
jgi:hypothetical protein